jgi:radical SAM superfamily enzyme YgiQ (UPF0313 family)
VGDSWPQYRYRSGRSVAQEMWKTYINTEIVDYHIADDLINGNLKNFKEFNLELQKIKTADQNFSACKYNGCFIVRDARSHSEDFFKLMAGGCNLLNIGVETGSDRLRFEMDKRFTNNDLDHHLAMCSKYKIKNVLMLFTSYPTETATDFSETLKMLERYQHYLMDNTIVGLHYPGPFNLRPGTPVYKNRDQLGLVENYYPEYIGSEKLNWLCTQNPTLTVKERLSRDLQFRLRAVELRYPIQYPHRYLEYLSVVDLGLNSILYDSYLLSFDTGHG